MKIFKVLLHLGLFILPACGLVQGADLDSIPSFVQLKESDLKSREALLRALVEISQWPLDKIESELTKRSQKIAATASMDTLDETMKASFLCGVLFEFPKLPASEAVNKMYPHGTFFYSDHPVPPDELVERMLPFYHNLDGSFDIRYFFGGYTGPKLSPRAGLEYFIYCRKTYGLRPTTKGSLKDAVQPRP